MAYEMDLIFSTEILNDPVFEEFYAVPSVRR